MGVHLGKKVRVGALFQEPALALQLRSHLLVHLVKEDELVEASDAKQHHTTQGHEGDHELLEHMGGVGNSEDDVRREPYITPGTGVGGGIVVVG